MASTLINTFRQQVRRASFMSIKLTDKSQRIINLESIDSLDIKGKKIIFYKETGRFWNDSRYFIVNYEDETFAMSQFNIVKKYLVDSGKLVDVDDKKV